jgi:hypothetical protein
LSADLSAFVCRFVCNFEGLGGGRSKARKALKGEGPRHGKTKKLCRQSLSKMQTKFCRQTLSRRVPPKCRQRLSKMQTRALNFSRKCRQNYADKLCLESGRGRLHSCSSTQRCRGCLQRNADKGCLQRNADKVCLQLQHVCFFGWFVQFIYSLFHFFGLSSQHHACRFLGIRVFDSAPPFGCGRAGARFLAGFFDFDFFSACPVFAWFLALCKAEAERQF